MVNLNTRSFLAYRGTHKDYIVNIIDKGLWLKSEGDDEFFGHGIYFFEEDDNEAYNWAKYKRKIPEKEIAIIQAYITCSRKEVLDLIHSRKYQEYIKLVNEIKNRFKEQPSKPKFKYPFDCGLINLICDKEGYKLVRGAYNPKNQLALSLINLGATRIPKIHIQLCVRDKSLINSYTVCMY